MIILIYHRTIVVHLKTDDVPLKTSSSHLTLGTASSKNIMFAFECFESERENAKKKKKKKKKKKE